MKSSTDEVAAESEPPGSAYAAGAGGATHRRRGINVIECVREYGPLTEPEIKKYLGNTKAVSSAVGRSADNGDLKRAIAAEGKGPMWLYYYQDSDILEKERGRRAWLPLFRRSEMVETAVRKAIDAARSEHKTEVTIDGIAIATGMKPPTIEDAFYSVGNELKLEPYVLNNEKRFRFPGESRRFVPG